MLLVWYSQYFEMRLSGVRSSIEAIEMHHLMGVVPVMLR
jgi:hypothetical protein